MADLFPMDAYGKILLSKQKTYIVGEDIINSSVCCSTFYQASVFY